MKLEHILAIKASRFESFKQNGIYRITEEDFYNDINKDIVLMRREELEEDPSYLQLIPYAGFSKTDNEGNTLNLTYRRVKGTGESKLLGDYSIGFGGHIDFMDVLATENSIIDVQSTVWNTLLREIKQEIRVDLTDEDVLKCVDIQFRGILLDRSNKVGTVHIGVIYDIRVIDEIVVESGEAQIELVGMIYARENTSLKFENWSRMILDEKYVDIG